MSVVKAVVPSVGPALDKPIGASWRCGGVSGPSYALLYEYLVTAGYADLGKGAYAAGYYPATADGSVAPNAWGASTNTGLYIAGPAGIVLGTWDPVEAAIATTTMVEVEAEDGVFYEYVVGYGAGTFAVTSGSLVLYQHTSELTASWLVADSEHLVRFYTDG